MSNIVILDTEIGWTKTAYNIDGGTPDSLYGGITLIDGGGV